MRPLELALEGFTSFRQAQTLDFAELDLFAITGPTGAGKSSLLDAITFALYGTTMRTGKQASELVSQGGTELKVRFRFVVRQVEYRLTRTWRYRPSTPETKVLLEKRDGADWATIETRSAAVQKIVEGIVAMDFDTFTRVILLPQGKFDEFLKGDAPKRRELLRSLAGFEVFERMRKEAGERHRRLRAEKEGLGHQLDALSVPDAEAMESSGKRLAALDSAMPGHQDAVSRLELSLAEAERLLKDLRRLAGLKSEMAALTGGAGAIDQLKGRLDAALRADRLRGEQSRVAEARARLDKAERALTSAEAKLKAAQGGLASQERELAEARARREAEEPGLKSRERKLLEAEAVEKERRRLAADAAAAEKTLGEKARRHAATEAALKSAEAAEAGSRKALEAAEKSAEGLSPGGDRLEALNRVAPALAEWRLRQKHVSQARARRDQANEALARAKAAQEAAQTACARAAGAMEKTGLALLAAREEQAKAGRHGHAAALRQGLHEGDDCPVCGGAVPESLPPLPGGTPIDLAPLEAEAAEADRLQRRAESELVRARTALESLTTQAEEAEQKLKGDEAELGALQGRIGAILGVDTWEAEGLDAEREALSRQDARHREAQLALKDAGARLREAEQALRFAMEAHDTASSALEDARALAEKEGDRLRTLEADLHALTGGQPYEALEQALAKDRAALDKAFEEAQAAHQATMTFVTQAEETSRQSKEAAQEAAQEARSAEAAWKGALERAGFDEAGFRAAQAEPGDQSAWKEAVERHDREYVRLSTLIEEVSAVVGDRATTEEEIAATRSELLAARSRLDAAQEESVNLKVWLSEAEHKRKAASEMTAKLAELSLEEQTYATLSRDLKADAFQDYLLEHLQTELVSRATGLLKEMTDHRYALRLKEGEFWVEDNWNGGELRRVRTLSGGETFATSLSMALALSEKLAMGAELGSLFLDEGFGTLDAETLDSVAQILESLRQQNRMIGVITHVRALGERLPNQIRVTKSPSGSRVAVEA